MILTMNEAMYCLQAAGFPYPQLVTGGAVGMAESGLETDRIGRLASRTTGVFDNEDLGWMQISTKWHEAQIVSLQGVNWRDPFENAKLAKQVYDSQGWNGWAAYSSGAHSKYLPMAQNALSHLWAPTPDGATLLWSRRLA